MCRSVPPEPKLCFMEQESTPTPHHPLLRGCCATEEDMQAGLYRGCVTGCYSGWGFKQKATPGPRASPLPWFALGSSLCWMCPVEASPFGQAGVWCHLQQLGRRKGAQWLCNREKVLLSAVIVTPDLATEGRRRGYEDIKPLIILME